MSNLNDLIDRTHFDYEQNEDKAKQLEERILKVPGMSKSYLPKRKYGENYRGDQLGVTAQSLIVKGDKALAAFLGLDLNYWKEKAKAEEEREAYLTAFKEKTEALRQKNLENKMAREKRTIWNQTHNITQRKY
ncbi:hypothetical protein HA150_06275 [Prochlorococcus marinus XMU1414]|uniref:Uncharacterized protein n=1 Tax=Prochlorococcus marinus XMU1424 TaxID=2774497 RepID=A0A9D9BVN6_PROMR|nr:hypothetical protein [Prochlorococcus marinus]MBO8228505.1 hypothetical protein [Prochlorococcus marinus XMU1414]MBW3045991.1 hypothetical protein [Prochlorococcus marinus str. MU1414]MCR8531723.1 hypothetical protein [Prochlorococcus marinus XMU1420]MCR8535452.1 hypothetical protein [Prochlorococcus marinus XMU1424]|tara:strand:+ start:134 stop:532 length:399 start_codon:yes stop_codon:yes gene_type:complete